MTIKARLGHLELTLPKYDLFSDPRCIEMMKGLRLPLPDATPQSVLDEGLTKLLAIQAAKMRSKNKLVREFRKWSDTIHAQYGEATNG